MMTKPKGVDEGVSVEEFASLPEEEGYRLELSRGRSALFPCGVSFGNFWCHFVPFRVGGRT